MPEGVRGVLERRRVVRPLVAGDSGPIQRLCRGVSIRMAFDDRSESPLSFIESFSGEGGVRPPKVQLGQKVLGRKETLDTMPLLARRIDDEDGWRPLHGVAAADALPLVGLLPHVNAYRDEMFVDELNHPIVGVHLGVQPSTTASHRGGGEVEQDVPALRRGIVDGRFEIVTPRNLLGLSHRVLHAERSKPEATSANIRESRAAVSNG